MGVCVCACGGVFGEGKKAKQLERASPRLDPGAGLGMLEARGPQAGVWLR